ncbi:MAG: glycosyltransferase, partial [Rhodothermales bacterium]
YLKWFYGRCVHLYVPTTETASDLNRHGIVEPIRLWSRGVDCERFHPSCRSAAWRSRHGFAPDDVVVSYVGRLVREKGLDVAASVIERLHRDGSNVRSLIVGDGPLRESLRKRLTETIFTGHLDGDALSTAYASSDIFLFPSDSEAFGNVIVEAMASGLPVVCAAGTGAGSHVADGRTGLVAPPRDADAFYDRTRRLVRDRALRETMGRRARAAAASYDWSQTLQNISNYYDEAIATMALRR